MTDMFIHPTKRYRLYFDETGTGDLKAHRKDQNQRYLSLTGLVFRQDVHDTTFTTRVSAFKRRIFKTADVILHRRDIMGREGVLIRQSAPISMRNLRTWWNISRGQHLQFLLTNKRILKGTRYGSLTRKMNLQNSRKNSNQANISQVLIHTRLGR